MTRARARIAVAGLALLFLLGGCSGTYAYLHDYDLYRGFAPPTEPAGIPHGRLVTEHFFSPAMGQRRSYLAYLPPGYRAGAAAGKRYPVLYLLQAPVGKARNYMQTGGLGVRVDKLLAHHRIRPFITVIPVAHAPLGTDHEWANTSSGRYEDFALDVVRSADARLATRPHRSDRMLAGLSAGAYGAVNITLHHLGMFGSFESWSGYFNQDRTDAFQGASPSLLYHNDPSAYLASVTPALHRHPVRAFLYQGRTDDEPVSQMIVFGQRLRATGSHVAVGVYGGKHNWALWRSQFSHMLTFAGHTFGRRP